MTRLVRGARPLRFRRSSPKRKVALSCGEAQEGISTRVDGERLACPRTSLDAHITTCEVCAKFETEAVALGHRAGLRVAKRAPDGLVAALVSVSRPATPPGLVAAGRRRPLQGFGFRHVSIRWARATLPVVIASVAVSVGAGWHPSLVPTRPPSPCTAGLPGYDLPVGPRLPGTQLPRS
jgi:anti-sigma factor RsiW